MQLPEEQRGAPSWDEAAATVSLNLCTPDSAVCGEIGGKAGGVRHIFCEVGEGAGGTSRVVWALGGREH